MRNVLITGASRGIGSACARAFSKNGDRVFLNYYRSEREAFALRDELARQNSEVYAVQADVSNAADVQRMFSVLEPYRNHLDVLINNAGVSSYGLVTDLGEEEWDRIFNVNVKGMFLCTKYALPGMIHRKSGVILNLSSIWGIVGAACESHYSASKGAVIAFTKALAKELAPSGIRVNSIAPGVVDTEMNRAELTEEELDALKSEIPVGRLGTPDEIAACALYLAGDGAAYLTGQIISPNGGFVI